jgi:hypothetical protein
MMTTSARFTISFVGMLLAAARASAYDVPHYEPDYWNQPGVQENNNCYNYAMNKRTDTFAQPGAAYEGGIAPLQPRDEPGGNPYEICDYVAWYALMDGSLGPVSLTNEADDSGECAGGPGYTKVALAVAPQFFDAQGDYHWYRRDSNGMWSHKPGGSPARNTDDCENLITSPETACRGNYELFCGYYCTASSSAAQGTGMMSIE